jgi:hypothetical protein
MRKTAQAYTPEARAMMSETLARVQAVNRLHDLIRNKSADEIEQLNASIETGSWRPE